MRSKRIFLPVNKTIRPAFKDESSKVNKMTEAELKQTPFENGISNSFCFNICVN